MTDRETSTRREHAISLGGQPSLITDIHGDVLAPHKIKALVRIGKIRDAAFSNTNLFVGAEKFVKAHRRFDILRREVDGFDLTTIGVGKIAARTANSATSVKYSHILCNASHFHLDLCRIETAAVKLVDKIQHFDRRTDRIVTRCCKSTHNSI